MNVTTAKETLRLFVLDARGALVLDTPLSRKTLSFSGLGECDHVVPCLGANAAFVTNKSPKASLLFHEKGKTPMTVTLDPGRPFSIGSATWLVSIEVANEVGAREVSFPGKLDTFSDQQSFSKTNQFLEHILAWLGRPMDSALELRESLKKFLAISIESSSAVSGMIVLVNDTGFDLISTQGLTQDEAESTWSKMPPQLTEDILRTKARIILPEALKEKASGKTTVFIKNLRSIVGFPVMAEGHVLAIFYLGYVNLVSELSEAWQNALEISSQILGITIQRALLREEMKSLKLHLSASSHTQNSDRIMIGSSQAIGNIYKLVARLANFTLPVLVTGETGTGKELVVRELHRFSDRATRPFVAVNAAALPENLIESELFGYKKGAFTGALSDRAGLIEQADGGTLFIDEIGELPLNLQAKLLRVLQEKTVTRLGENKPRSIDFRLVAATHRDLKSMVAAKQFREDLYFRVAGSLIEIPPLRERREDIVPLAKFFVNRFARGHSLQEKDFSRSALSTLEAWAWTGNVRELENVVQRAFVMAEGPVIERDDLGLHSSSPRSDEDVHSQKNSGTDLASAKDDWMRNYISDALRRNEGNRADTAKELGIGQRTLFRYLDQLGIRGL